MEAVPYISGVNQDVVKEMAGFSHTLPSCLSKLRSSLEAAWKQAKRSIEYGYSMEKALLLTDERLYTDRNR